MGAVSLSASLVLGPGLGFLVQLFVRTCTLFSRRWLHVLGYFGTCHLS